MQQVTYPPAWYGASDIRLVTKVLVRDVILGTNEHAARSLAASGHWNKFSFDESTTTTYICTPIGHIRLAAKCKTIKPKYQFVMIYRQPLCEPDAKPIVQQSSLRIQYVNYTFSVKHPNVYTNDQTNVHKNTGKCKTNPPPPPEIVTAQTCNEEVCMFFELFRVLADNVVESEVQLVVGQHLLCLLRRLPGRIAVRLLQHITTWLNCFAGWVTTS